MLLVQPLPKWQGKYFVDVIKILDGRDEMAVIKEAGEAAVAAAILKGADPGDVRIVEIDKIPLKFFNNKATRIRVKAIEKLRAPVVISLEATSMPAAPSIHDSDVDETGEGEKRQVDANSHKTSTKLSLEIDIAVYRPAIRDEIWYLSEVDLEFIACGTGILGTGRGGPSYLAYLVGLDALRTGGKDNMRVLSPNCLKDDDLVCFGSWYCAPSVSGERLPAETEIPTAIDALNEILGVKDFQALLADEIGGGNGLATFPTSVHYDRPTVDGDMMGRAYPSMEHGSGADISHGKC
jgi:hypothetical protein